jgi:large conductance mechanosensitive channel
MINEFKQFIMRGNVLDMAVGIIIGGAFGKIVASMVSDVLMPVIGLILGKINFANLFFDLSGTKPVSVEAAKAAGAATLNYGLFTQSIVDFLIIAFVIFLLVKQVNRLMPKKEEAPAPPATKDCPRCLSAIPIKATRCAHCTSDV